MESFSLRVLAEDNVLIDARCESLVLPLIDGLYGIQANHSPMISAVVPGTLRCSLANGDSFTAAVSAGLVKVDKGQVLVLVERASTRGELEALRKERAAEEAEAARRSRLSAREYGAAQANLIRVTNRLKKKGRTDKL